MMTEPNILYKNIIPLQKLPCKEKYEKQITFRQLLST